jgi:hypothetical protein
MATAGYWGIGIIEDIFELDIVKDAASSTEGKVAAVVFVVVVLVAGGLLMRRYRQVLARYI